MKKNLRKFQIKRTFIAYFVSYLSVLTLLVLGFFLILKNQIIQKTFVQFSEQTREQLTHYTDQLNDEFKNLAQVDTSIKQNQTLLFARYDNSELSQMQIKEELLQYTDSFSLIDSIIYLPENYDQIISTKYYVSYADGTFLIRLSYTDEYPVIFTPALGYYGFHTGQCLYLTTENKECLLYFPPQNKEVNYTYFYLLNLADIQEQMKSQLSATVPAIALVDCQGNIVAAQNSELLTPHMDSVILEDGVYTIDPSTSINVKTGIYTGLSIVYIISNDNLNHYINDSFSGIYLMLLLLSIAGFILILLAMRTTYSPLHQLVQRFIPAPDDTQSHLQQLDSFFRDVSAKNNLQETKLSHYRLFMQKSLLDSCIHSDQAYPAALPQYIDQLFDLTLEKEIFIIRMKSTDQPLLPQDIQEIFQQSLPAKSSCILMEKKNDVIVFLISYTGIEPHKGEILKELLISINEEQGYLSAISNSSSSPLDIPYLYENAMYAANFWPDITVVDHQICPSETNTIPYPYKIINQLSESLKDNKFSEARAYVRELFSITVSSLQPESGFPDFFVQSVLIDVLTTIADNLHQMNIKFERYNELYFETLYFCRSFPHQKKKDEISANILKLIDLCEQEISCKIINSVQIRQIFENSYHQPSFSIQSLADTFQTSIAYMSYLVKKELHQNFSEYLWNLRQKKAEELLCNTDMSIDDISMAVGYFNTSSFRRKFKQETGLTPSQYRETTQKTSK